MTIAEIVTQYLYSKKGQEITEYMIETECPVFAEENFDTFHLGSSYSRLFRKVRNEIDLEIKEVPNRKHKTWIVKDTAKELSLFE